MALPKLIIIGAQKSGTTAIHAALMQHPRVMPAIHPETGEIVKEVQFFAYRYEKGLDWYESHFPIPPEDFGPVTYTESTPCYFCDGRAPKRLAQTINDVRLIVTLRDPVERAYSHFNHYSQIVDKSQKWDWKRPGGSFHENILAEFENPYENWYGLVKRGYYDEQFERYLCFFPRDQIHVMIMERWSLDPDAAMSELLEFAELEPCEVPFHRIHARPYDQELMDSATESLLREHYRPHVQRLGEILGDPIKEWL